MGRIWRRESLWTVVGVASIITFSGLPIISFYGAFALLLWTDDLGQDDLAIVSLCVLCGVLSSLFLVYPFIRATRYTAVRLHARVSLDPETVLRLLAGYLEGWGMVPTLVEDRRQLPAVREIRDRGVTSGLRFELDGREVILEVGYYGGTFMWLGPVPMQAGEGLREFVVGTDRLLRGVIHDRPIPQAVPTH